MSKTKGTRKPRLTHVAAAIVQPEVEELFGEFMAAQGLAASSYLNLETRQTTISVFLEGTSDWAVLEPRLKSAWAEAYPEATGFPKFRLKRLRKRDWAEAWKRHFKPIRIARTLLVRPPWIKSPAPTHCKVVVLEPGLSFGTGQHPTTSFCLREIARLRTRARSFLDVGTGSGILAIAAAKLGYAPVRAFDYDPEAVRIARANARRNRVERRMEVKVGDLTKMKPGGAKADLVCANLISNLLIEQSAKIISRVKPNGTLVLAGILASEFSKVQHHYESAGFRIIRTGAQKEWKSGSLQAGPSI